MPARANVATMKELQERLQPNVFSPKGAYDGRKNLFTARRLDLGDSDSRVVRRTPSTNNCSAMLMLFKTSV